MFELIKRGSTKNVAGAIKKLEEVSSVIPTTDVLSFLNNLTEAYKESKITERETARIIAQKEILLSEIDNRYNLYHQIFNQIFDERKVAIAKSFEVIDKGLKEGNNDLVSMGMQGLSKVVSTSPFANVDQLSKMIENKNIIEI